MSTALGPRVVIAGTHSGVGKTTVATGLMAAFRARGTTVASAKVGPDFIDPAYHAAATGRPARNLDPWICGADAIAPLAGRAGAGADLLITEGVMGLYDGSGDDTPASTADVAILIDAPVILVVDARAMSQSVAALVRGYRDHDPRVRLAGVILNFVGSARHETLLRDALATIDQPVVGALHRDDDLTWRSRHLGLVPVAEDPAAIAASLDRLATVVAEQCDLDAVALIAATAPRRPVSDPLLPEPAGRARVAVAAGRAFTFSYEDNLEALAAAGAELIPFDPLTATDLPDGIDAVVAGGGFPEVYAAELAANVALNAVLRRRIADGLVVWAECGGLLWLARTLDGHRLVDAIGADGAMAGHLTLGYRRAVANTDSPVAPAGTELRGHEFHYSTLDPPGDAWTFREGPVPRLEGFASRRVLATYLHLHLGGNPAPARRLVDVAERARGHCPT
ncbi:MAG: cobyrinate a,c-diamide synthase [Actinomycetota bacterium]|nr:cobyrinate a,c-diamide synthase [Actinomycetota bacterium]